MSKRFRRARTLVYWVASNDKPLRYNSCFFSSLYDFGSWWVYVHEQNMIPSPKLTIFKLNLELDAELTFFNLDLKNMFASHYGIELGYYYVDLNANR